MYECLQKPAAPAQNVLSWYTPGVKRLKTSVDKLCTVLASHQSSTVVQQAFCASRLAYKEVEVLAEYFNPYTVQLINGKRDDTVNNKSRKVFQKLECLLYPELQTTDTQMAYIEARRLAAAVNTLCEGTHNPVPSDAQLFDAMRLELVRIISLGISGFDSHEAGLSLKEAAASLRGIKSVWNLYADRVNIYNPSLVIYTETLMTAAEKQLENSDSVAFDKQLFISDYINHLSVNLKLSREALSIPYGDDSFVLDPAASNIFARDAVHPLYKSADPAADPVGSNDPLYEINGQQFRASYLYTLLQQNGALNTVAVDYR
jgi:cytochrome c peroxidase